MLMVRNFLRDLPDRLFEAARIDGCTEFMIWRRILLPLRRPILATLAVTSSSTRNEFLLPLVVMQDEPMFRCRRPAQSTGDPAAGGR
jgi:multiple sugar transport system permease protein